MIFLPRFMDNDGVGKILAAASLALKVHPQEFAESCWIYELCSQLAAWFEAAMQTYQKAHHSPLQEQGCGVSWLTLLYDKRDIQICGCFINLC